MAGMKIHCLSSFEQTGPSPEEATGISDVSKLLFQFGFATFQLNYCPEPSPCCLVSVVS